MKRINQGLDQKPGGLRFRLPVVMGEVQLLHRSAAADGRRRRVTDPGGQACLKSAILCGNVMAFRGERFCRPEG